MVALSQAEQTLHTDHTTIDEKRSRLAQRLEHGFRVIDQHREAGLPTEAYEEHWLRLLADYEALYEDSNVTGS